MSDCNDPSLRSWVASANEPNTDFPLQNLPLGVFSRRSGPRYVLRVGVAIGDRVLDLAEVWPELRPESAMLGIELFDEPSLNGFLAAGRPMWTETRRTVSQWLRADNSELRDDTELRRRALIPMEDVEMHLPVEVGDYTDFYSSQHHASNVGSMFRDPENPLLPNWKHIPVGYHGRASSIVVSGTEIRRPSGQTKADDASAPTFGPSRLLDFELEVGFITGPGNDLGEPISVDDAADHIFGLVLVNDWSARDIQKWEYVPLGPFLAKNFATTISPWVVPLEALEPFRVRTPRAANDPPVLPYLNGAWEWNLDLHLEVALRSAKMRKHGSDPHVVCRTNFRWMYWNMCQQLAHQTVTGCNVQPGDLYASGTVSGPTRDSRGSMLELSWRGTEPIQLPATGEQRRFLEDGDEVLITGFCGPTNTGGKDGGSAANGTGNTDNRPRIGFGECRGRIVPAHQPT